MRRTLPVLIALPVVIAAGYVHGRWTDRWTASEAVRAAAERLTKVPMTIGAWNGRDLPLDRATIEVGGIDGHIMRRYEDPRTGEAVSILLVCGRPGPIAAHTPEVCYGGAGYEPLDEPKERTVRVEGGEPAKFLSAVFVRPKSSDPTSLRLLWSWNGEGRWETSDNPRLAFARDRFLYKLYVVRETVTPRDAPGDDAALAFTELFLPELQKVLF